LYDFLIFLCILYVCRAAFGVINDWIAGITSNRYMACIDIAGHKFKPSRSTIAFSLCG